MQITQVVVLMIGLLFGASLLADDLCQTELNDITLAELKRLANVDNAAAQAELGRQYEYGICLEQSDSQAITWYRKAAKKNDPNANYRLGVLYDNGWGVVENDVLAAKYYSASARRNHPMAQHDLALMYHEGAGVSQDPVSAYKWLFIAVNNGNDLMRDQLLRIAKTMTAEQISNAETMAFMWKPEN